MAVHRSHFPGDLCVELEIPDAFALLIVGLNSTWLQYCGDDFERRLEIPLRQFHAALPAAASPLAIFRRYRRALLVMYHPPAWLSPRGRKTFLEEIYLPDRFYLCLHGHLHEARTESVAISGGAARYYFQSPSLFGLKRYGSRNETRAMGYAWGTLSAEGEVRLWPLKRITRGDGTAEFVHDQYFREDPKGVLIRSPQGPPPLVEKRPAADLRPYLEDLVDRTDHINVRGIVTESATGALRPPIERLDTPLRSRGEPRGLGGPS